MRWEHCKTQTTLIFLSLTPEAFTDIHSLQIIWPYLSQSAHIHSACLSLDSPHVRMGGISHLIICHIYTACKAPKHTCLTGDVNVHAQILLHMKTLSHTCHTWACRKGVKGCFYEYFAFLHVVMCINTCTPSHTNTQKVTEVSWNWRVSIFELSAMSCKIHLAGTVLEYHRVY